MISSNHSSSLHCSNYHRATYHELSSCTSCIVFVSVKTSITNSSVLSRNEGQTRCSSPPNFRVKISFARGWMEVGHVYNRVLDFITSEARLEVFCPRNSSAKMYSPARFLSENFRTGRRGETRREGLSNKTVL